MLNTLKTLSAIPLIAATLSVGTAAPVHAGNDPFIGEIIMFGGDFCPRGWASLEGQLLPISNHSALFSILGTTYGGDGRTTFGLPDLRGRTPIGFGNGPGLTAHTRGQKGGQESYPPNMPRHSHGVTVTLHGTPSEGTADSPNANIFAQPDNDTQVYANKPATVKDLGPEVVTVTEQEQGNGARNPVMQPYLAMRYCLALQGTFPSRN